MSPDVSIKKAPYYLSAAILRHPLYLSFGAAWQWGAQPRHKALPAGSGKTIEFHSYLQANRAAQ